MRAHDEDCATLCASAAEGRKCRVGHGCWCTSYDCAGLGFLDPDRVEASEYRAIYDFISDALVGAEDEVMDPPAVFAHAMLEEFVAHAHAMMRILTGEDAR